jgi:hypothetical protein
MSMDKHRLTVPFFIPIVVSVVTPVESKSRDSRESERTVGKWCAYDLDSLECQKRNWARCKSQLYANGSAHQSKSDL